LIFLCRSRHRRCPSKIGGRRRSMFGRYEIERWRSATEPGLDAQSVAEHPGNPDQRPVSAISSSPALSGGASSMPPRSPVRSACLPMILACSLPRSTCLAGPNARVRRKEVTVAGSPCRGNAAAWLSPQRQPLLSNRVQNRSPPTRDASAKVSRTQTARVVEFSSLTWRRSR